ncbi:MAG: potassium transporter TrkG, partial [Syntrophomonas sp.]|nr:potassium transporter TrkG [Syntrophomonas sp.]
MIRTRVILGYLGRIILIIGISMLSSVLCSLYYRESIIIPFILAAGVTIATGLLLVFSAEKQAIHYKEGFVIVSLGWLLASLFGSLPYIFTGCLPSFADAFFETVSGFTTTGASVITNVEATPKGLLFWRSLTQWLGGMGIIGLFVAIISGMGAQANHLFKAEVPGPVASKISPRVRETAKKLWITYIILSVCCAVLLYLFGMDIFDSLCHTFATMATGGFSTRNASVGYYDSPLIQWTLTLFMFIAGVNFTLHYLGFKQRNLQVYLKNREFLFYTAIVVVASLLVTLSLSLGGRELSSEGKLRAAFFQVVTIVTTTGYSSVDFE